MKRKLVLLSAVILFLVTFGALMHSPPSIFDTISGATPRAKRAAQEAAQLEGDYFFCINVYADGLRDASVRDELKDFVTGKTDSLQSASGISLYLYVPETDYALVRYAEKLQNRLEKAGVSDVLLKEYSSTMLRSRALSGRYEAFLCTDGLIHVEDLKSADYITLKSSEMR